MTIINGREIAQEILEEQKKIIDQYQLKPKLATILIDDDEASRIYINEKRKKANKIGIDFQNFNFLTSMPQKKIIDLIKKLNNDRTVSGIIVQFPLPKNFDANAIVKTIDPQKDVDGFHPENIKKFLRLKTMCNLLNKNLLLPVTPAAVIEILNKIDVGGDAPWRVSTKNIVLIGKPSIFTVPLIHYFSQKNKFQVSSFKFQVLSPVDPDLQKKSRQADILITAVGHPHLIKKEMIKKGAIVIDIGISRLRGKVVGDIDFKNVIPQCSWITPVPGGVGPVTVAVLLRNVVKSALLFFGEAQ